MTTEGDGAGRLDSHWLDWLVAQLLDGRPSLELIQVMVHRGFSRSYAETELVALAGSPVLASCRRARRGPAKLEQLVELLGELFSRSGFELQRRRLAPQRFFAEHFYPNRPVVLTGLTDDWPAVRRWGPDYFRSRFGDVEVEISQHRDADASYERNFPAHRRQVSFAEYVSLIEGGDGNDCYLVARNHVLDLPGLRALSSDFSCPEGILDPQTGELPFVRLWFGPAGTLTPLHCDDRNILFAQVTGRKLVKLVPPYFIGKLYNEVGCYSSVTLEEVDLERFPDMRAVPVYETVLEPGECLFIPLGWWHWVRSLEVSTSLTFTNFQHDEPPLIWRRVTS